MHYRPAPQLVQLYVELTFLVRETVSENGVGIACLQSEAQLSNVTHYRTEIQWKNAYLIETDSGYRWALMVSDQAGTFDDSVKGKEW